MHFLRDNVLKNILQKFDFPVLLGSVGKFNAINECIVIKRDQPLHLRSFKTSLNCSGPGLAWPNMQNNIINIFVGLRLLFNGNGRHTDVVFLQ